MLTMLNAVNAIDQMLNFFSEKVHISAFIMLIISALSTVKLDSNMCSV